MQAIALQLMHEMFGFSMLSRVKTLFPVRGLKHVKLSLLFTQPKTF